MQIPLENGQELKRGIWFKAIHFGGFLQSYIFPFIFKLGTSTYFYPIPHVSMCCLAEATGELVSDHPGFFAYQEQGKEQSQSLHATCREARGTLC